MILQNRVINDIKIGYNGMDRVELRIIVAKADTHNNKQWRDTLTY